MTFVQIAMGTQSNVWYQQCPTQISRKFQDRWQKHITLTNMYDLTQMKCEYVPMCTGEKLDFFTNVDIQWAPCLKMTASRMLHLLFLWQEITTLCHHYHNTSMRLKTCTTFISNKPVSLFFVSFYMRSSLLLGAFVMISSTLMIISAASVADKRTACFTLNDS